MPREMTRRVMTPRVMLTFAKKISMFKIMSAPTAGLGRTEKPATSRRAPTQRAPRSFVAQIKECSAIDVCHVRLERRTTAETMLPVLIPSAIPSFAV
jgi:hypothetical protein